MIIITTTTTTISTTTTVGDKKHYDYYYDDDYYWLLFQQDEDDGDAVRASTQGSAEVVRLSLPVEDGFGFRITQISRSLTVEESEDAFLPSSSMDQRYGKVHVGIRGQYMQVEWSTLGSFKKSFRKSGTLTTAASAGLSEL